jgi:Pro-kumamolisin, activation domain
MIRATLVLSFVGTSLMLLRAQIPVDEDHRVMMHDGTPRVHQAYDAGSSDPSRTIGPMFLVFSTAIPEDTYADIFFLHSSHGRTAMGRLAVIRWLRSHSLTIESLSAACIGLSFRGTVAQVEETFRVEIHDYLLNGKVYHASATYPSIPSAVSRFVAGVNLADEVQWVSVANLNSRSPLTMLDFMNTCNYPVCNGLSSVFESGVGKAKNFLPRYVALVDVARFDGRGGFRFRAFSEWTAGAYGTQIKI